MTLSNLHCVYTMWCHFCVTVLMLCGQLSFLHRECCVVLKYRRQYPLFVFLYVIFQCVQCYVFNCFTACIAACAMQRIPCGLWPDATLQLQMQCSLWPSHSSGHAHGSVSWEYKCDDTVTFMYVHLFWPNERHTFLHHLHAKDGYISTEAFILGSVILVSSTANKKHKWCMPSDWRWIKSSSWGCHCILKGGFWAVFFFHNKGPMETGPCITVH